MWARMRLWLGLWLALAPLAARAETVRADGPIDAGPPAAAASAPGAAATAGSRESICLLIEAAARAHGLPVEFFARVIWQESRFDAGAVGPVTRSGERALGMAQFMPRTAAERGLLDPFDPVQALPKSAEFLGALRAEFGNLGLAAAAYNAGPQRLRDFIAGSGPMPGETRRYVLAITGLAIEEWIDAGSDRGRASAGAPPPDCRVLMALLRRAPSAFVSELERRVTLVAASAWGVQLAAGFSRAQVLASYSRLARRYAGVLAGRDPSILSGRLRSRGTRTFYQVRVGADTRTAAEGLCRQLRQVGGPCLVLRNPGG